MTYCVANHQREIKVFNFTFEELSCNPSFYTDKVTHCDSSFFQIFHLAPPSGQHFNVSDTLETHETGA